MLFEVRRQRIRGVPVPKEERSRIVPVCGDLRVQEAGAEAMGDFYKPAWEIYAGLELASNWPR